VGLTVLRRSAKTIPALRQFKWPKNSSCRSLNSFQSRPARAHVPVPENALKGDVVDRQEGADAVVVRARSESAGVPGLAERAVLLAQVDSRQGRLPVVEMQHVGPEIEQADGFEDGAG